MIKFDWGEGTATNLLLNGFNVQFKGYSDIDHAIGDEQVYFSATCLKIMMKY